MTTALAIIATVISLAALAVSIVTARHNRRSADAAEASAASSDRSADAAKDAADSARAVARAEVGRDHRELAPDLSDGKFKAVKNSRTGKEDWFFFFHLPKTYRMFGDAVNEGGGRTAFELGGAVLEAGFEQKIFVAEKRGVPFPELLEFRFYPPAPNDPGETWSCPCGEPAVAEYDARGHWVVRMPVKKPPAIATIGVPRGTL